MTTVLDQADAVVGRVLAERLLVTGGKPDVLVPIPDDRLFEDNEVEYLECPEGAEIGAALIGAREEFAHLTTATIRYLWKRKGTKKCGREVLGTCQRPGGLVRYLGRCDFVVCFAADFLRKSRPDRWHFEALTAHELGHCDWDPETDKPATRDHDVEAFYFEPRLYGLWRDELVVAADAFAQAALPGLGR